MCFDFVELQSLLSEEVTTSVYARHFVWSVDHLIYVMEIS